jgi:hypothetical protein
MRCVVWSFNDISQKSASQKSPFISSKPVYVTSGGIAIRGKAECSRISAGEPEPQPQWGTDPIVFLQSAPRFLQQM